MKRKTLLALAVLLTALACLFTSCSASVEPPKAEEEFGYVTFGNGGSRSLSTEYGIKSYDSLYWYYTATKKDSFGLTGQTTGQTAVLPKTADGKGIGSGSIRLSQGAWEFELFAYEGRNADLTGNNLVYKGTSDIIVLKGGETKAVPVSVNLQGATGVVNFSQAYFEWANNSAADGKISVTVELAKDGSDPIIYFFGPLTRSGAKYTFASNDDTKPVPEGYYTCTVNAYMEEDVNVANQSVDADATPLATQTLGLRVYGNATTYITDNLTEGIFAKVVFDVAEQDMKVFVPNTDGSASITGISVTPSGDTTKTTSVEFSDNALSGLAKDVTLQLDVKVTPVEAANEKFNITGVDSSNKSAFAGIDITLMQTTSDGQTSPVNSFNDNLSTTARVTTYIAKGLSNVQVKYSGNPDETITSTYNPDDGCLSFTTYHFSEYYILAETVAVNVNKNIAYNDLEKAVKDANDGDIIKLYKDVTLNKVLEIGKSIIIYGNDHNINNSANRVISITKPDISVELYNLGVISTCTADSDVRGISFWDGTDNSSLLLDGCTVSASFYAINIIPGSSNLNITIKNGTVAAGWAAINSYSNNSTFNIENSTLEGLNDKGESTWNDYATIVFDGNGLWYQNNIGTYGSGNTMTISNSTIFASSDSSNNQAWLAIQYGAMNNDIILSNTTVKDDNNENQINNISICPFVGYSKGHYSKSYDLHSTLSVDGDVTKICYHGEIDYEAILLDNGVHVPYEGCEDIEWSNVVTITPEKVSSTTWNSDTLYYLAPGQYNDFSAYLHGKENVGFCALPDATFTKVEIGYHAGQDSSLSAKQNSTLTIKGFNVNGYLRVNSADQKVVIEGNTAAQITLKTYQFDNMNIQLINNTLTGGSDTTKAPQQYGLYIVPNKTNYNLMISGNTFRGISKHAIGVQGNGDGSAETAANSIIVQNNTFESYGLDGKDGRAAFKIWEDGNYAPTEKGSITDSALSLVQSIKEGNNTYSNNLGANCVLGNFYDTLVPFNE